MKRIDSAVCAFGGRVTSSSKQKSMVSIFRIDGLASRSRRDYDKSLSRRYIINGSRISWEVEDDPPVFVSNEDSPQNTPDGFNPDRIGTSRPSSIRNDSQDSRTDSSANSNEINLTTEPPKMKYRCKLCGQPKQNHNCPYQKALQRNIGVMVYPAVNSYTAAEPGSIAPALTQMNNFVSYESEHGSPEPAYLAGRSLVANQNGQSMVHPSTVTPEALRSGAQSTNSPQSSMSVRSDDAQISFGQASDKCGSKRKVFQAKANRKRLPKSGSPFSAGRTPSGSPFVNSVSLRPEHYRAVTPCHSVEMPSAFEYPAIPLTFAERKRLSDTLFHLSKEIPAITQECAEVLKEARRNADWDQAVAELLSQVIVGLFCDEDDTRLHGLHLYLLGLGVAC